VGSIYTLFSQTVTYMYISQTIVKTLLDLNRLVRHVGTYIVTTMVNNINR